MIPSYTKNKNNIYGGSGGSSGSDGSNNRVVLVTVTKAVINICISLLKTYEIVTTNMCKFRWFMRDGRSSDCQNGTVD